MRGRLPVLLLAAALAGCSDKSSDGPVAVSVIGTAPTITDPDRKPLAPASAALMAAVAEGLVRFDAAGQIEPGAAIRWAVSQDGLHYTFRIENDAGIDAALAAARLRRAVARASRNPLKPVLGAIDEVVAVTPQVVEVRLHAPRPNLLQLFAQPELALVRGGGGGAGPFRIGGRKDGALLLTPAGAEAEDLDKAALDAREVRLRGERVGLALARFIAGKADAVLGGSFVDLPVARVAALPARALRFDAALGLFGIEFRDTSGFLGSVENRRALAMAVDRDRLAVAFGARDWRTAATIVPGGMPDLPAPARPDWIDTDLAERRANAAGAIARWGTAGGATPLLRLALPPGPGSRLLFNALRRDWGGIGVTLVAVPAGAPADLRLIDAVAPADIASWYLRRFACEQSVVCSGQADAALIAARVATSLAERNTHLADADARLAEITPFIPLAMPLRWSAVSSRLDGFQGNARAVHPLDHLRGQ